MKIWVFSFTFVLRIVAPASMAKLSCGASKEVLGGSLHSVFDPGIYSLYNPTWFNGSGAFCLAGICWYRRRNRKPQTAISHSTSYIGRLGNRECRKNRCLPCSGCVQWQCGPTSAAPANHML